MEMGLIAILAITIIMIYLLKETIITIFLENQIQTLVSFSLLFRRYSWYLLIGSDH